MSTRFTIANGAGYIVIRDRDNCHRPVMAFMPNEARPHAPRLLAEICVKALNAENAKYKR
jgi:hypothetical protein